MKLKIDLMKKIPILCDYSEKAVLHKIGIFYLYKRVLLSEKLVEDAFA